MKEKLFIGVNGKRYSGKDYISGIIKKYLGPLSLQIGLGYIGRVKYSEVSGVPLQDLMTPGKRELYRKDLISFLEGAKKDNVNIWCENLVNYAKETDFNTLVISDLRRLHEIDFFRANSRFLTIRVDDSLDNRRKRGFSFTKGVDDGITETELDDFKEFDYVLNKTNMSDQEVWNFCKRISKSIMALK